MSMLKLKSFNNYRSTLFIALWVICIYEARAFGRCGCDRRVELSDTNGCLESSSRFSLRYNLFCVTGNFFACIFLKNYQHNGITCCKICTCIVAVIIFQFQKIPTSLTSIKHPSMETAFFHIRNKLAEV